VSGASGAKRFVLTGAPGTGKTATLDPLRATFTCIAEPAREVLAEQRATGGRGTWDQDAVLFVELLLDRAMQRYRSTLDAMGSQGSRIFVFDRGIPDLIVYAALAGADPTPSLDAARGLRYEEEVLLLEPWSEIYATDEERVMAFEDTVPFGEQLREAYEAVGYSVVPVPRGSVEERAAFVRSFIERRATG
jgi:predicted ATPase